MVEPRRPGPFHISGDQAGGVGIHPVDDELNGGGTTSMDLFNEIRPHPNDAVHAMRLERLDGLSHRGHGGDVEIARSVKRSCQAGGFRAWMLHHESQGNACGIEGNPVAEEEQEKEGHEEGDGQAAGIPKDLLALLADQAGQPHARPSPPRIRGWTGVTAGHEETP